MSNPPRRWMCICIKLLSTILYATLLLKAHAATGASVTNVSRPLSGPPQETSPSLRFLTTDVLEISWISRASSLPRNSDLEGTLKPANIALKAQSDTVPIGAIGFKRHSAYAPLKKPGLLVRNSVYIQLASPLDPTQTLTLTVNATPPWKDKGPLEAHGSLLNPSPVIHLNQTGYLANGKKVALVGYYLGTLGELKIGAKAFEVLDVSDNVVFASNLVSRKDVGFPYVAYQHVWEADFTSLNKPGVYRIQIDGIGRSAPFRIGDEYAGVLARTYALGLYHQRCGTANSLPFTRFIHDPCHTRPAMIPDSSASNENCNWTLATENESRATESRQTAPLMKSVASSLYPFVRHGAVDVWGGHHDAGDYSKYTINSASFIHFLVTACDAFPGVASLDNLGLPESGDSKADVLQEAKWEADFLSKMQDSDGGFYFLVYPQGRRYEDDVTPDKGDPQVVFPKNTAATAAAVAALAQCASSPAFRKQFPEAIPGYLQKANKGWAFLEKAITERGKDGSYQRITHYGDEFMHDDELTWAAVEMFLATGSADCARRVSEWLHPGSPELRKWGWWRLFDAQGCAIRSYGLAVHTGRLGKEKLDSTLLEDCQRELISAAQDQMDRSEKSAYGTSFPIETKQARSAGWYFSPDAAFDLAVGVQLATRDEERLRFKEAILSNLNYEQGCNPVNITYLTGLGYYRQFEIVHQYAQNDRRIFPPSGIPLGNVQGGMSWVEPYKALPDTMSIPSYDNEDAPYPFYDRWSDAFNLSQEFVILNQARGLGVAAWLMAQTALKDQAWKSADALITGLPEKPRAGQTYTLGISLKGIDLSQAAIAWEASTAHSAIAQQWEWRPSKQGPFWIEAEAQLPDGRRVFATANGTVVR